MKILKVFVFRDDTSEGFFENLSQKLEIIEGKAS